MLSDYASDDLRNLAATERSTNRIERPTHFGTDLGNERPGERIGILSAGGRVPMQGSFSACLGHDPERILDFLRTHTIVQEYGFVVTYTKLLHPHVHNTESDANKWRELAVAIEEQYNKVRMAHALE